MGALPMSPCSASGLRDKPYQAICKASQEADFTAIDGYTKPALSGSFPNAQIESLMQLQLWRQKLRSFIKSFERLQIASSYLIKIYRMECNQQPQPQHSRCIAICISQLEVMEFWVPFGHIFSSWSSKNDPEGRPALHRDQGTSFCFVAYAFAYVPLYPPVAAVSSFVSISRLLSTASSSLEAFSDSSFICLTSLSASPDHANRSLELSRAYRTLF
ncbi:hypothetical protein K458DRAFT_432786 [Lentithecium fluviatile CBS 122367]|uniref:Uncharacterized protein n=1 Tax=Lentithecium fluviatile CBS 122367 TaxID=1168545 RepID=A0A6G1IX67_9PLEO|nr:hypothetical protein K458DRAFT_432786 [Lentithecium fluviatile CBS 122367]